LNPRADSRQAKGARAEDLAARHLAGRGLVVVERNFRTRQGEIDLVARDGDSLVFVEVRMRSRREFGGAAGSVTAAKRARWVAAAQAYLARIGREPPCRFDVVLLDALDPSRVEWVRDVLEV
jgi:putative endonuclease